MQSLCVGSCAHLWLPTKQEMDLRPSPEELEHLEFEFDGERIVDDFVLLVSLTGNDFIPHLPSLDIGEGALDDLFELYREELPELGGYLCDAGTIDFRRLEVSYAAAKPHHIVSIYATAHHMRYREV